MASYRDYLESDEVVVQLGASDQPGRQLEPAESTGPLQARILWPALGFPATIAPRSQASGSPFKASDATRCVTLLVLTNRAVLSPAEVAGALRYVPWGGRGRRNLPAGPNASFSEDEIEIQGETSKAGFALPNGKDSLGELIAFGGGPDSERRVVATLANRVREFYRGIGLVHLKEVRISEQASARLADGLYHLFWNNNAPGEDAASDEMALLLERFARPRRSKLGSLWQQQGAYLLDEYAYEYRPMHPWSGPSVKGKRTEILHPLLVDRARTERLRVGHLTDTHVSVREDVYEQNLMRAGSKVAFNNWNTSFVKGYDGVKRDSDIILLTGDIIDYGRGHWGREAIGSLQQDGLYHEDRNWFLFHDLLASGDAYSVPVYTSLGNHDWRINPYPPFAVAGAPGPRLFLHDHASYPNEEQRRILALAHGPGYGRKFSYQTAAESKAQLILEEPGSALKAFAKLVTQTRTLDEPGSPTETTVESVAWYLLAINPFFDYAFVLPSGHQVLMLDWAEDEDVLFPIIFQGREWPYMLWQLETASNPGPKAKRCLTSLQKRLVTHLLESPGRAKLIGMHSPPIGPYPDWLDLDMLAGRKTYTDKTKARGRTDYGTKRPDGTMEPWNGHPIFALRPRSGDAGMDTDYNSFVEWRDWFIKQVADPKHGVRAVFSGHIHRNGLYAAYTAPAARGPLLAGEMLVRGVVEPAVRGARPPAIVRTPDAFTGPLYVNTTSGGPRGNNMSRPPTEAERKTGGLSEDPGYARLDLSLDGTIQMVEFRSSLAAAAQKPAPRELAIESILEELGLGSGGQGGYTPEVPGWMGAPATGGAPAAVMEANPMVEQLTGTALGGYAENQLPENEVDLLAGGASTRRIFPGEPVEWFGEDLGLVEAEQAESSSGGPLEPEVADLAERVMARAPSMAQETATWTRCFTQTEIESVAAAYAENLTAAASDSGARCSCIVMLNVALGKLLPLQVKQNRARGTSDRRVQMAALTTESVDQAMQQLRDQGFATAPTVLDFLDSRDRTAGTLKPERLKDSVQDAVLKLSDTDGCWFAYGMSVMDGYHSVLLLVDRRTSAGKIYWLDQFSGGLDTDVTSSLDQRLTDKTQAWWQSVMDTKKKGYSTMIRVWPLRKQRSP
jgi:hypothetical protein